jgi:flagella basal body P-ring formation protein FlgA
MRLLALLLPLLLGLAAPAGAALLPPGAPLTSDFAEALVQDALRADGAAGAFRITIERPALPLGNPTTLATEVALEQFRYDPAAGRFHGALTGTLDGRERFRLPIFGRAEAVLRVPALRRAVAPDEVIAAADLTWVEVPPASLPPASFTAPAQVVGSQARRRLAPGRVLTERDLGPPYLVRRGRPVELIYARPGLYVTALGVAQEDGALGDPVRVLNAESRRQLQGIVSGPDEVAFGPVAALGQSAGRAP